MKEAYKPASGIREIKPQVQGAKKLKIEAYLFICESLNFLRRHSNWEFLNGLLSGLPPVRQGATGQKWLAQDQEQGQGQDQAIQTPSLQRGATAKKSVNLF
ncbi:hypothetical protein C6366_16105 [Desulfonatronum sp. SC1]|nr:hypothetical protein C6366_16105 [Desulfonatronum sp. SC1]